MSDLSSETNNDQPEQRRSFMNSPVAEDGPARNHVGRPSAAADQDDDDAEEVIEGHHAGTCDPAEDRPAAVRNVFVGGWNENYSGGNNEEQRSGDDVIIEVLSREVSISSDQQIQRLTQPRRVESTSSRTAQGPDSAVRQQGSQRPVLAPLPGQQTETCRRGGGGASPNGNDDDEDDRGNHDRDFHYASPPAAAGGGGRGVPLRDIPRCLDDLPRLFFDFQATVDTDGTLTAAPTAAAGDSKKIVCMIRRATKYMAQCATPDRDFGDVANMITLLDGWRLIESAGALTTVVEDYDKRLNETADAQENELRLFDNLSALVPLDEHIDPEEGEMSNNTFLPEAQRLHDVILDQPDRRTLTSKTPATRLALRDIIPCPASYDITPWWIMQMFSSFWLLIVLTFINIDLMNLNYLIEPYVDSSGGCFFESRSDCCNPKLNSAVTSSASATTTTELYARGVNRSCCSFNCMWNNETFTHYRDRWIDFVGASVGDCARMLLAVGGARVEDTPDLTGPSMLYVSDEWIFNLNSSDSSESYIGATALSNAFKSTCKDSEACQRFIIITQQQFHKEWTNLLSTKRVIHYVVFVESSWRFIDAGCQSNSRRIIVPMSSNTEFSTGALIAGWLLFGVAVVALVGAPYVLNWLHVPIKDTKTASRGEMFGPFLKASVFRLLLLLAMSFSTALLSPEPNSGLLLLAFCAAIRCFFSIVSLLRLGVRLYHSVVGKPHENVLFAHLHAKSAARPASLLKERFQASISAHDNDSECPHSTTWSETLLSLVCCFYFMSMAGILRDVKLNFVGSASRSYLIDLFDNWVYHRSLFTIFHLAFVPIGLELVLHVPAWVGYATDSTLPRLRWLVVIYGLVFVWYSATLFPTTLDEIGKAVLGFTSQLVADFGPLGSGQRRLGSAFALLLLFFVFLRLIYDMEAALLMKPWVVLRACFIRVYAEIHYPNSCAFRSKHPGARYAERAALLTAFAHLPGITDALCALRGATHNSVNLASTMPAQAAGDSCTTANESRDPNLDQSPPSRELNDLISLIEKAHQWRFDQRKGIVVNVQDPLIGWIMSLLPHLFLDETQPDCERAFQYMFSQGEFCHAVQFRDQMFTASCVYLGPMAFVRHTWTHDDPSEDQWYVFDTAAGSCSVCRGRVVEELYRLNADAERISRAGIFFSCVAPRNVDGTTVLVPVTRAPTRTRVLAGPTRASLRQCGSCGQFRISEWVFNAQSSVDLVPVCECQECNRSWPVPLDVSNDDSSSNDDNTRQPYSSSSPINVGHMNTSTRDKNTSALPPIPPTATCVSVTELSQKAAAWIASGSSNIRTVCIVNSVKIDPALTLPLPQVQRLVFLNREDDRLTLQLADAERFAATFPNLLELSARHIAINGTLASLSTCKNLQSLHLSRCSEIDDDGLKCLSGVRTLQSLNLHYCNKISDTGLQYLRGLPALRFLKLSECKQITDAGLEHLSGSRPSGDPGPELQSLELRGCHRITDAGLEHLSGMKQLQSLNLYWCTEITSLQHLRTLTTLQSLDVGGSKITDAALENLKELKQLQSLSLYYCTKITDAGLLHLRGLKALRLLNLCGCSVGADVMDKLTKEDIPGLTIELKGWNTWIGMMVEWWTGRNPSRKVA